MPSSITKSGFKLTGDVLFNEVAPKCSLYHSGSGWRRAYDNHFFDA